MSEVMEKDVLTPEQPETEQVPAKRTVKNKWKNMPRKKRRRIIRWVVILLLLGAAAAAAWHFFGSKSEPEAEVVTDFVSYGAITSTVEGSGLTKSKNSETISLTTAGTVMEVFVTEGQQVMAGDPLFVIESEAARVAVEAARKNVEGYEKQLSTLQKDIAGLNLAPTYPGKLLETVKLNPGDEISKGFVVATLADDTRLRLQQYYSYAYAGDLYVGQSVDVSIPALMTTLTGTVEAVHMVSRITPEGSKLFSVEVLVDNPGTLTAEMVASATTVVDGETVYPYESGKLGILRAAQTMQEAK